MNDHATTMGNQWADGIRAGDTAALGAAFDYYRDRLARIAIFRFQGLLERRVDLDDVLQESYLAAAKRIDAFKRDGFQSVFIWLRLIVMQTITDLQRHHLGAAKRDAGRERSFQIGTSSSGSGGGRSLVDHLTETSTSPSVAIHKRDLMDQVKLAIAAMEPVDQEILTLRHFEEMGNNEVAEQLGLGKKAASMRYIRALRRLQDHLQTVRRGMDTETLNG